MDRGANKWLVLHHLDGFTGSGKRNAHAKKSIVTNVRAAVWLDHGRSSQMKNSVPVAVPAPKFS